jgi:hypothetical protein
MKIKQTEHTVPLTVEGHVNDIELTAELDFWYPWLSRLKGSDCYLKLFTEWRIDSHGYVQLPDPPPNGHEYYIVSGDSSMFGLAEHFAKFVNGKIIQLTLPLITDEFNTSQITYLPYNHFHQRLNKLKTTTVSKNITHKASALVNRLSQSKIIIFAALMANIGADDLLVSLCPTGLKKGRIREQFDNKNLTNNPVCDSYIELFYDQWINKRLELPYDDQDHLSYNNSAYQNSALNFTQETYNYSFVVKDGRGYIEPGPLLTEKTTKCLMSKTAFIPVGQMHSYHWLKTLGLKFDYGELDLDFDNDPGNLTRLEKIINLIHSLKQWSAQDLYTMTRDSTEHNYEHVNSQAFWNSCEAVNEKFYTYLGTIK